MTTPRFDLNWGVVCLTLLYESPTAIRNRLGTSWYWVSEGVYTVSDLVLVKDSLGISSCCQVVLKECHSSDGNVVEREFMGYN
ncbi:hypothetical protein GCM10028817_32760 [Spirosoma pomorum]